MTPEEFKLLRDARSGQMDSPQSADQLVLSDAHGWGWVTTNGGQIILTAAGERAYLQASGLHLESAWAALTWPQDDQLAIRAIRAFDEDECMDWAGKKFRVRAMKPLERRPGEVELAVALELVSNAM